MDVNLIKTKDYDKKTHWTLGENKPKQSQSFDLAQDRSKTIKDKANVKMGKLYFSPRRTWRSRQSSQWSANML
jgi:hypothetical protein